MNFDPAWLGDPSVFSVERLPAHAACVYCDGQGRPLSADLNGPWKFYWAPSLRQAPTGFSNPGFDVQLWDDIRVPGAIPLQGKGRWGAPQYVNIMYPWDGREKPALGDVPQENPVGTYVKDFVLPRDWTGPVHIQFDGADSALAVWCNGTFVGYSEGSFTPAAFDLTPYLEYKGVNRVAAQVFRFCSGSWLEDQDFWRMPGLFRGVSLHTLPITHMADIDARALLSDDFSLGELAITVTMEGVLQGKLALEMEGRCIQVPITDMEMQLRFPVRSPQLWSAEAPHLYPYTLRVVDEYGTVLEQVKLRAGFRRFELKNGLMLLNGKRIVFKGVNRHEWNCHTGRTITLADMKADILAMKRHNINAVRTSHYPNMTEWYDLCDAYGIYVIDEMNLETHGTWQKPLSRMHDENTLPGDHPAWREAVLDRAVSMLERDKNHPSILLWSCGNESGGGRTLFEVSEYFRHRDPSRLVHYEGIFHNRRFAATSDVESQMYPSVEAIENFLQNNPDKPFICCEYSHAMGNSCGGLFKYTDLTLREPRYQGGFIWDWIDQALCVKTPSGAEVLAYGGDFDDHPNDGDFCADGLLFADRTPSPKLQEVAACYQDFTVTPSKYVLTIQNNTLFQDLSEFTIQVELHRRGKLCESRELQAQAAPGETAILPLPFVVPAQPGEYTVTAQVALSRAMPWAEAGHVVAQGQCVIKREKSSLPCLTPVNVTQGDYNIGVRGTGFSMLFSRTTGMITSYCKDGVELLQQPPQLSFWRAPTANDRGCHMPFVYAPWKTAGPYARLVQCNVSGTPLRTDITALFALPTPGHETVTLTWGVSGDGHVEARLVWNGTETQTCVPEFGLQFVLPRTYQHVEYYGNGPQENYCDRRRGALLGRFDYNVVQNATPYLVPQECGNRTGVRHAAVLNAAGDGMVFVCEEGMDMSALPYTAHELELAHHAFALPPITKTVVRCSMGQMGVGGDDSWGATPHDEFLCRLAPKASFRFTFYGVANHRFDD